MGWPVAGLVLLAAGGCKDVVGDAPAPEPEKFPPIQDIAVGHPPGLKVDAAPVTEVATLVNSVKPASRPDPFALFTPEREYDVKAHNELVFSQTGQFFPAVFVPKPIPVTVDVVEPQPFRRLAGVLVGDSVMAIIDMGDNSPMQLIRPGMQIPNSPWKVISIDEEKAVLRRSGNVRPKEIVVRLQGPIAGSGQQPTFNPTPTGNPGGNPGQPVNPGGGFNPGRGGKFGGGGAGAGSGGAG